MKKTNPRLLENATSVARVIHTILIDRDLHHAEVSLAAGLGRDYLRDLFRGKSQRPNYVDLVKISDALGVEIGDLAQEGAAPIYKESSEEPQTEEHRALLDLWDMLSDEGRDKAIGEIAKLIIRYRRRP